MKLIEAKDKLKIGDRVMVVATATGEILLAGVLTKADDLTIVIVPKVKITMWKDRGSALGTISTTFDGAEIFKR